MKISFDFSSVAKVLLSFVLINYPLNFVPRKKVACLGSLSRPHAS